jgi:hypothetical protein
MLHLILLTEPIDRAIQIKPDFADAYRRRGILKATIFQDVRGGF